MSLTTDLLDHLTTYSGVSGYYATVGGIRDDLTDFANASKWLSVRRNGGGGIDPLYSNATYQVMIGGKQSNTFEFENASDGIIDFMNTNYEIGTIRNIVVQSQPVGPILLSDDRVYFLIAIQILQNRG